MAGNSEASRPLGLIEQLAEAVLALDSDGSVAMANGAAGALFGRPQRDLVGRRAGELLSARLRRVAVPDDLLDPQAGDEAAREDGSIAADAGDGRAVPVELRVVPAGDQRLVAVRDISERVDTQDALRASSARIEADAPDANVGSWEWDIAANEVRWSDQLYRIYGLEPGAITPTYERFLEYVHPDDRASVDARNRKAFADHEPFRDVKRVRRADGTEIAMRTQGEVICDEAGQPVRMIGVCEDVTEFELVNATLAGLGAA